MTGRLWARRSTPFEEGSCPFVEQVCNLRRVSNRPSATVSGFTLLEMIVATLIMSIAVVGLLGAISGAARNAARVREYDRIVQLARLRMNDLMLDPGLASGGVQSGQFSPQITGGLDAGWQARSTVFASPPHPAPNLTALDRIELQVWWMSGPQKRTFTLEAFRQRSLKDIATQ